MNKEVLPAIRFSLREYRLYINLALLESLGNPTYLQFLFSDARKMLAISGSQKKEKHSFEVPARTYRDADDECYISRMPLAEAFRIRMHWDARENYRVTGLYAEHLGVVIFELAKAVVVRKDGDDSRR